MSVRNWLASLVMLCVAMPPLDAAEVDSGGTGRDAVRLEQAATKARHGHYTVALAVVDGVLETSPHLAAAYFERANIYMDAGRNAEALADLDRVASMHPDTAEVFVLRAELDLRQRAATPALAELARANAAPERSLWKHDTVAFTSRLGSVMYIDSSIAHELQGEADAALSDLKNALANETLYPWHVLGRHCYTAALAGLLEMAELTCTEAIDKETHDEGAYDSRGLVYLKMHAWDKAIADYDRALRARPDLTISLYGRGVARHAKGDRAGGDADIAAATQGEPDIANVMTRLGVQPL